MTIDFDSPTMGGEIGVLRENILELRSLYNQVSASRTKFEIEKHHYGLVDLAERRIDKKLGDAVKDVVAISASHEKLKAKVDSNWKRHRTTVKALEAALEKLGERVAALEGATTPVADDQQVIEWGNAITFENIGPFVLGGFSLASETQEA